MDHAETLASACRVLAHHRMIDPCGHLSLRPPGSDRVLCTPRFSKHCLPRTIRAEDILVCDAAGRVVEGRGQPPAGLDPQAQASIFAAPHTAMAAAIAGFSLRPLTHMESETVFAPSSITHEPGIGVRTVGKDIHECLATMYHLEYLAQVNLVVAGESGVRGIAREDSAKIWQQFRGHHHYHEFFASLDPGPLEHPYAAFSRKHDDPLKSALAFSCRALWERGTLVAFLEHISHRAPGGKHFYMTASKNYRDMEPTDICVLDYEANSIDGPKPPGFKWFHAQLLRERQDALAVVHTHDVYGRAYALSPRKLVPSYRVGLDIAMGPLPTYGRCDLIVDPEVRRATLDALADGPVVHEIGHGTDFVADNLWQATVDAIQREAFLEMDALTRRFGVAKAIPQKRILELKKDQPTAEDWWYFYAAEVGAPRRSAAGL
jgi:ribulose-5-phosphate 4-epimerase/fuculose-1-phosphate aldolase